MKRKQYNGMVMIENKDINDIIFNGGIFCYGEFFYLREKEFEVIKEFGFMTYNKINNFNNVETYLIKIDKEKKNE